MINFTSAITVFALFATINAQAAELEIWNDTKGVTHIVCINARQYPAEKDQPPVKSYTLNYLPGDADRYVDENGVQHMAIDEETKRKIERQVQEYAVEQEQERIRAREIEKQEATTRKQEEKSNLKGEIARRAQSALDSLKISGANSPMFINDLKNLGKAEREYAKTLSSEERAAFIARERQNADAATQQMNNSMMQLKLDSMNREIEETQSKMQRMQYDAYSYR